MAAATRARAFAAPMTRMLSNRGGETFDPVTATRSGASMSPSFMPRLSARARARASTSSGESGSAASRPSTAARAWRAFSGVPFFGSSSSTAGAAGSSKRNRTMAGTSESSFTRSWIRGAMARSRSSVPGPSPVTSPASFSTGAIAAAKPCGLSLRM